MTQIHGAIASERISGTQRLPPEAETGGQEKTASTPAITLTTYTARA